VDLEKRKQRAENEMQRNFFDNLSRFMMWTQEHPTATQILSIAAALAPLLLLLLILLL